MTSSSNNNPYYNPSNDDSLAGTLQFAFSKMLQNINGMLPAKIISYDRTTNRAQVQLLIAILTTDGAQVSRPQIASIPVLILGGGGFMINFPLNPGDLGWVIANDRDISLFLQTYNESPPNTYRMKNFSDGLFIPDIMKGYTINSEDNSNLVLSSIDGTIRISIFNNKIKLTAPDVNINGNVTVSGMITGEDGISITGGSGFTVVGDLNLTGNIAVIGNITATGTITPGV